MSLDRSNQMIRKKIESLEKFIRTDPESRNYKDLIQTQTERLNALLVQAKKSQDPEVHRELGETSRSLRKQEESFHAYLKKHHPTFEDPRFKTIFTMVIEERLDWVVMDDVLAKLSMVNRGQMTMSQATNYGMDYVIQKEGLPSDFFNKMPE